ncbi:protein FAR1-RELATED SEQUENCE 5-like [Bidens hawaiensis]|uniref:protein FAR1-RELATED SEQUENCE 5-like n=1 Tax=Bidens hawaiensis TaxID=980011 RepID=UPI0040498209
MDVIPIQYQIEEPIQVVHEELMDNDAGEEVGVEERGDQRDLLESHNENSSHNQSYTSPNETRYWLPNVDDDLKPVVGRIYPTWEDAETMYKLYADKAGFDTRLSTIKRHKGVITNRYILCNRAGIYRGKDIDTLIKKSPRSINYKVTDCQARVRLKAVKGTPSFQLNEFVESHNHGLVADENKDLTRSRRQLDFSDHEFIHKARLNLHNYYFVYVAVKGELRSLFWADDVAKCNYSAFGDVLAFDATYKTNMYDMIFVPFTGVDHHKKCVTFGAGLLHNETIESYKWLLEFFLEAHGNKQPTLVLSDQDPAMKQAISIVLTKSVHRLCMWHIMDKLRLKVSKEQLKNGELYRSIHKLVWNVFIDPPTFERKWVALMTEFKLNDHDWLKQMYDIREQWVPGYFRDIPMCCLMKTTSRCESSNASFKVNSSPSNTLVQFMLCFELSMGTQREKERVLQNKTITKTPRYRLNTPIEQHAGYVYTRDIFFEVQKEMIKVQHPV